MKRDTLVQIAEKVIARRQGQAPRDQAEAIADAIEVALMVDGGQPMSDVVHGSVTDVDTRPLGQAERAALARAPIPSTPRSVIAPPNSPAVSPLGVKGLVEETQTEGEAPRKLVPRIPAAQSAAKVVDEEYWTVQELSAELHKAAPARITVSIDHPTRGEVRIPLDRNVVVGSGFDCVKLIYKYSQAGDDLAATVVFQTTEKEINVDAAMDNIMAQAKVLYSYKADKSLPNANFYDPNAQISMSMLNQKQGTIVDIP